MMDKQKALKTERRSYRERIISILLAERISKKIIPHLPKGWEAKYGFGGSLLIQKWENANAVEFRVVCDLIAKVTGKGKRIKRRATGESCLRGELSYFDKGNMYRWVSIEIFMGKAEGCKIEKKRKVMTIYEASPECLGMRGGT